MEKINKISEKAAGITVILITVWILCCCLFKNDVWKSERLVLIFLSAAMCFGLWKLKEWLYEKKESIDKYFKWILAVFLIFYGVCVFFIGLELRFEPIFDLDAIYGGARQWYLTGSFKDYEIYFYHFKNNLGGLLLLYLADTVLGYFIQDFFLIALIVNTIGLILTAFFTSMVCKESFGAPAGVMSLLITVLFLPFWFMGAAFYTDALSLPFTAGSLYAFVKLKKAKKVKSILGWGIMTGLLGASGGTIKGTVYIITIAIVITLFLRKKGKELMTALAGIAVSALLLNGIILGMFYGKYLTDDNLIKEQYPKTHWIMMGLSGNGAYNPQDYEFTSSFGNNTQARQQAINQEIKERIKNRGISGMLTLFMEKTVIDYGDGTLGLSDFLDDNPVKESGLHKYVLYSGEYYALYRQFCSLIMFTYLLFFLYKNCLEWRSKKVTDGTLTMVQIAFIGEFLFLMMWETSNRYFGNFMPILMLGTAGGIEKADFKEIKRNVSESGIIDKLKKIAGKIWENKTFRIFSCAVLFRLAVYVFSLCIMAMFGEYQDIRLQDFLDAWTRWDSAHYLNIAENGYHGAIEDGQHLFLVFYPLYPWLIRTVAFVIGNYQLAGILISTVCFGIGSVYLYKVTCMEAGEETGRNTIKLLAVYPFSFFFGAILTESLFFAVLTAFFYYLRKHRWWMAGFIGFLACLTRVQGILLAFTVIAELLYSYHGFALIRNGKIKEFFKDIICNGLKCVPMVGGTLIYLLVNYLVEGDPFRFMYYEKSHWNQSLCPIWHTYQYVKGNALGGWDTQFGMALWDPEYLLFFVYFIVIIYGIVKKQRPMYLTYLILYFIMTNSVTWLLSGPRYSLNALPLFMLGGQFLSEHSKIKPAVYMCSLAFMVLYMIGFYQWKSIM